MTPREELVAGAVSLLGKPYRWRGTFSKGDPDGGGDCSGMIYRVGEDSEVWAGDRFWADEIWRTWPGVAPKDLQPGDVACFGRAGVCEHVVLVEVAPVPGTLVGGTYVGACHGGPPLDGETPQDYAARMDAAGARVVREPSGYWASALLGFVRFPSLAAPAPEAA